MISYKILSDAQSHYSLLGYSYVEVPWTVTPEIAALTKPLEMDFLGDYFLPKKGKTLVGSAEQSFLYQYSKGFLPRGKFQAITPCFREDIHDVTHEKAFMKLELIDTTNSKPSMDNLVDMVENARDFFSRYILPEHIENLKIVSVGDTFDIEYEGIEIGSYGIRDVGFMSYIYGTIS